MSLATKQKIRKKKRLGSAKFSVVLLSITLSLTIVGVLSALLLHANSLIKSVKENIELHIYLDANLNENTKIKLGEELLSYPFVNKDAEKPLEFKSVVDISEQLIEKKYLPADFDKILGFNPIKPCYVLKISSKYATEEKLQKIAAQLNESIGVYEVDLSSERGKDLSIIVKNLNLISSILAIFTLIAIITISFLINNTIKLALFSQRFLIRSMQLVGAEKKFIKKPFILNASIQGAIGGVIASSITYFAIQMTYTKLGDLNLLLAPNDLYLLLGGLTLLGSTIGFLSSLLALNRYLKLSLDELY